MQHGVAVCSWPRRAVFLDRDGTLIDDLGYLRDPRQVRLTGGAILALRALRSHEYSLVIVSNQSGVGRGLITLDDVWSVHRQMVKYLEEEGVFLDGAYYCPHEPEQRCTCRKPSPGMLMRAAKELGLTLASSFMVGDKISDIEAGERAGCQTILYQHSGSLVRSKVVPDYQTDSWLEVTRYILKDGEL